MTFVKPRAMAVRTRVVAAAVTVGLMVMVSVALPAGAAQPDLTTRCVGVAGPVTVPGDLVVPTGRSCELQGTIVEGDVRVAETANLIAEGATLNGALVAQLDAYVDLIDSTVAGRVTLRDAYGLYSESSDLGGIAINTVDAGVVPAVVLAVDSSIAGGLKAQIGDVLVTGTTVAGRVSGDGVGYLDVIDSVVGGDLTVTDTDQGSVVCDSEVYGSGVFAGNAGFVQLGGDYPVEVCAGANYWDGNIAIDSNTADLWVTDNIVRGDLAGAGNDPAPGGENNRVRGATGGQFIDLQPEAAQASASPSGAIDRHADLHAKIDQRRTTATANAHQAGPADL